MKLRNRQTKMEIGITNSNKQQALDRLNLIRVWYEDYGTPDADYDAIVYAIGVIEEMPEGMDTLIKALEQEHQKLSEMQKAQPEIIRCKDCKLNPKYEWFSCPMSHLSEKQRPETAWCWKAERRTDE